VSSSPTPVHDPDFGPNDWFVEDMWERFQENPTSVPDSWRRFFEDRQSHDPAQGEVHPNPSTPPVPASPLPPKDRAPQNSTPPASPPEQVKIPSNGGGAPLRGPAQALARNMERSLSVPVATSVRRIPAKALEINRTIINNQLSRDGRPKISFGHIITWAIVKAFGAHPGMNVAYVAPKEGEAPSIKRFDRVNIGVAIDLARPDGSRSLMVPVLKNAAQLEPREFFAAYDELIARVRSQKVTADDFAGATATVTNPGTLGTEHSIPRLMEGQAAIIGVGAIAYPAEFAAADPQVLNELGIAKTVTITSTYDHRVIQGAESGEFLSTLNDSITGKTDFYKEIFDSLEVAYEPAKWTVDHGSSLGSPPSEQAEKQIHVQTLIDSYRVRGHLLARLDPLDMTPPTVTPELDPATYGLTLWDLSRTFLTDGLAGTRTATLQEILSILRDTYCGVIGYEYMHIQSPDERRWIQDRSEGVVNTLTKQEKLDILATLNDAEAFEKFLSTRYIGQKRFGLEGAESAIVFLTEVLNRAAETNTRSAVIGMAHRGRLNVLTNIVGKSYRMIFEEFEGNLDPDSVQGSGDVKYHKGFEGHFRTRFGSEIPLTLASNPSHLEAVNPVVEGMVRAYQDLRGNLYEFSVLGILLHGDASFAGQGVVAETLNLSQLPGYRTGGTLHLVINNQVGFTTNPADARSSVYASDVAKMVQAPIFHVNGDDPEAVVRTAQLAIEYRNTFHKDVVVDMLCYRRHGHNEGDEPSYTQPLMYQTIENHPSTRKLYAEKLVRNGAITEREAQDALDQYLNRLQQALNETREAAPPKATELPAAPVANPELERITTRVPRETLDLIFDTLDGTPEGFVLHPKLVRQFTARRELYNQGEIDWALAEAFAYGSLLLDGRDVRFSGQDSRRGTFSHRHAALIDYHTGETIIPLDSLRERGPEGTGRFMIYDSLLSEYAAMGFEYGYSLINTRALTIWEAQFGDFYNGAQIIVDQFIAGALEKWNQHSGLVLLLPHGYEGQGPEHSSARIERFLSLAANGNISVAYPTTSAQMFHLLRTQVSLEPRRPLVVATPKSLLRAKQSRSHISDLTDGEFIPVIDDPTVESLGGRATIKRLVLCSGKIAYDAIAARDQGGFTSAAIVRIEQLYPWPEQEIAKLLLSYPGIADLVWLQEEPENMGAWPTVHHHLHRATEGGPRIRHVSRIPAGSPATGSAAMHALEQADLLTRALRSPLPD